MNYTATRLILLSALLIASFNTVQAASPTPYAYGARRRLNVLATAPELTDTTCASEAGCDKCTQAYAQDASKFPWTIAYTKTGDLATSTFVFLVCSAECAADDLHCASLSKLQLRLKDSLLSSAVDSVPEGIASTKCSGLGPGYAYNATALGSLSNGDPAEERLCKTFSIKITSSGGDLEELCQQGVTVTDEFGTTIFDQDAFNPGSCLYQVTLSDGTSGYGTISKVAALQNIGTTGGSDSSTETTGSDSSKGGPSPYGPSPYARRLSFNRQLKDKNTKFTRLNLF